MGMISISDMILISLLSIFISFLTLTTLPLVSWCFTIISFISSFSILTRIYSLDVTSPRIATSNESDAKGCTFLWKIESLKHCWLKKGECIRSPAFTAGSLYGTVWSLCFFPKGVKNNNLATVALKRENDHSGPSVLPVKYQISLLDKDGSILEDKLLRVNDFQRENVVFFSVCFLKNVSDAERKSFVPEGTLTLQCKIWNKDEEPVVLELLSARSVFEVQRKFFVWKIDGFSTRIPDPGNKFIIMDKWTDDVITLNLVLQVGLDCEEKLGIDIRSVDDCIRFVSLNVSIIDSKGIKVNCGPESLDGNLKKGIFFPLPLCMLMNEKSRYLPNDGLTLDCEYAYSFVTSLNECAKCGSLSPLTTGGIVKTKQVITVDKNSKFVSILANDLESIYSNAELCDIELRTSTQTFPTHKVILSARSSVFRRMFNSDMKEKNCGHVDVTDLDDETVHRMLLYIYTECLEDLQMESASKLYTAADKYDISFLKRKCSSFLKDNLHPSTACDVLVLADRHQDPELKNAVEYYILENDKEVFDTQEWKHFMATNLQLAADVMYQKVSQARTQP